jgi:predicted ATPase
MAAAPLTRITRVVLKNYKSIVACDVELQPLTILVGPNGSGKSNFLDALRFVSDALNDGLETAVRKRGNMDSLLTRSALGDPDARVKLEFHLNLPGDRLGIYSIELCRPTPGGYRIILESCTVIAARTSDILSEVIVQPSNIEMFDPSTGHHLPLKLDPFKGRTLFLPHLGEHQNFGPVYRMLRGMAFYNLNVTTMREPHKHDDGERLVADGANLASTFRRMSEENDFGWVPGERVAEYLAAINADIRNVDVTSADGYALLRFVQRAHGGHGQWTFTADEVSDGTLRSFGVLTALFQGRMSNELPVSLVGIEEPEAGLHPAAAGVLLGALQDASATTQVIVTTHSNTLLDSDDVDVESILAVLAEEGVTKIGPVDEVGRSILRDKLFTAGELLHLDQLRPERDSTNGSGGEPSMPTPIPGRS